MLLRKGNNGGHRTYMIMDNNAPKNRGPKGGDTAHEKGLLH